MAGGKKPRTNSRRLDYWCHPQKDGHATLYFRGHELISRAEYVSAVGPEDCDPYIAIGQSAIRKSGPRRSERDQRKRM
jgi:hypothetical protein